MKSQLDVVGEGKGRQNREGEQRDRRKRESRDRALGKMGEAGSGRLSSEYVSILGMVSVPFGCHRFSWMNEKQEESE